MTQALQALYDHALETRFSALLVTPDYHTADELFSKHLDALRRMLQPEQKVILDKLCDALYEQRDLELEAMFQAAWCVAREL